MSETPEVSAERRAEYWKAEHAAANVVIDRLERQRDELAAALREAVAMLDESSSPYIDGCGEDLRWTERRNSMLDEHRALLARLGEGGEG